MGLITYFDLIQKDDFREFVSQRLANTTGDSQYSFPLSFPPLYKYRSLSEYAVDDIINGHITATSIGDFNDLFDGAIHRYATQEECTQAAEKKWDELERLGISDCQPEGLLTHDYYVRECVERLKEDSRLKFRMLDYLGTYACCFSSEYDSPLMWAHYADSNTGMCVEYDFNNSRPNTLGKKMLFPVAYSKEPVSTRDLLDDEERKVFQYSFDAAVLCAALNKSDVWSYENEWRLVFVLVTAKENERRIQIPVTAPISISFGYHFLKPFFYYDSKNKQERERAEAKIKNMLRLLSYIEKQEFKVFITTPVIGKYGLVRNPININDLKKFMNRHFKDRGPESMQYYYVVHDELMNLIEREPPNA